MPDRRPVLPDHEDVAAVGLERHDADGAGVVDDLPFEDEAVRADKPRCDDPEETPIKPLPLPYLAEAGRLRTPVKRPTSHPTASRSSSSSRGVRSLALARAAPTSPLKSGWARSGRLLNSG